MITKLAIRNLRANAGRFAMTTFGVVLAVSFVVSAFVLGDGLRKTFGDLSTDIVAGTDLEVRPLDEFGSTTRLSDADVAAVAAIDGVDQAIGLVEAPENSVRPITPSGDEIPTAGPPQLAFSWTDAPGFSPFTLVDGASPDVGDFLIDIGSADRHDFVVGETYTVVTATGRHELELSGLVRFGSDNQTLGATLMAMNAAQTEELFGTVGYDSIAVALTESGLADIGGVQAQVAASLPDLEVVDQATLTDETSAEFNSQIGIIQNILLGFAGVSLLVSIFIIGNTFAIVLQQRTREMGLLRLVGADARQLRRGAMGEAGAIGLLASAVGIPGGIGVAAGLTALFGLIGADLPDYDIIVSPRTLLVAIGVGLGVTLVAAWWPTRTASQVPAMAALRTGDAGTEPSYRTRNIAGAIIGAVGIGAALTGVFVEAATATTITLIAGGAVAVFAAVTLVGPLLVAPVVAMLGGVLERMGMPGRLAVRNARRQAGRTATTAAALMIGLAVVTMALVVGESVKTRLGETIDTAIAADYLLIEEASESGFPAALVDELQAEPAFDAVSGFSDDDLRVDGVVTGVTAANFADLPQLLDIGITEGGYPAGGDLASSVLISDEVAAEQGIGVGDRVEATMSSGVDVALTVTGIYTDDSLIDDEWLVDTVVFEGAGVGTSATWVAMSALDGADASTIDAAIAAIEQRYPQGEIDTAGEFRERMEGLIDQILSVLNALVALAVIIALIGIANTLALSVSERTREIGLLRAVGMSSRGVRRMIRYESAVIAAFGALLGVVMGVGLGWLMVQALPAAFADSLAIPGVRIAVLVTVAAAAGLVAALLPARRAGRMNVLAAIAG